jgi:hypothetical protein
MSNQEAINLTELLPSLPYGLRRDLLSSYQEILRNFRDSRWEPAELNGGKFCEAVYTVLRGCARGSFDERASKPPNMLDACRALEREDGSLPRSVRIQIPRMLIALYEIRNNRGVGHAGGDVNPNHMDSVAVLYMAKWILAELIRLLHRVDTEAATQTVDALVERELPVVWEIGSNKRVLDPQLSKKDATLLLLCATRGAVHEADLARWVEQPSLGYFRRDVLRPAHRARLIEFDAETGLVHLSPLGIRYAEEKQRSMLTDSGG